MTPVLFLSKLFFYKQKTEENRILLLLASLCEFLATAKLVYQLYIKPSSYQGFKTSYARRNI